MCNQTFIIVNEFNARETLWAQSYHFKLTNWFKSFKSLFIFALDESIRWRVSDGNSFTSPRLREWWWAAGSDSRCETPCRIRRTAAVYRGPASRRTRDSCTRGSSSSGRLCRPCTRVRLTLIWQKRGSSTIAPNIWSLDCTNMVKIKAYVRY